MDNLPSVVVFGIPLILVVPAMVNLLKSWGLPSVYAGAAAIACSAVVLGLVELQAHEQAGGVATWLLASLVYGLASAGLYSQVRKFTEGDLG